ncbi:MAG: hypothetical protein IPK88_00525 [Saprospiraceae bacterium]|nr:hypothetical protein [Candidatus Defluviibacterium haderslevense]
MINLLRTTSSANYSKEFVSNAFKRIGKLGTIVSIYWPQLRNEQFPHLIVRASAYNSNKEVITKIEGLKYPPLEFNKNYQRASTPDDSMFYCTLNKGLDFTNLQPQLETCFRETFSDYIKLIAKNNSICFSLWKIKQPIRLLTVFKVNDFNKDLDAYKEIRDAYQKGNYNTDDTLRSITNEFSDLLADKFSIPVDENTIDYKSSGLINQHMIKTYNYMHEEIDGIVFKSTKSPSSDFNLTILPDSCIQNYNV